MTDLNPTIIANSNQLNADDLIGREQVIKITNVSAGSADQPIKINYEGDNGKPFFPCKSMRRVLVHCWGNDGKGYIGRSLKLFRDPEVMFGGMKVGGIRIKEMSDIKSAQSMALTARRGSKANFTVKPLQVTEPAPQIDADTLMSNAEAAANQGMAQYEAFFKALSNAERKVISPRHEELKKLAESEPENEEPISF